MPLSLKHAVGGAGLAILFGASIGSVASAQERMNLRGTIEKVDGQVLNVASRDGTPLTIKLADNANVRGVVTVPLSELKAGSYVGISSMPQADGSQRAISVTLFPEGTRPTEGQRPHDLQPGSMMTNAPVETVVAGTDGQVLTVKYKQGDKVDEKKIIVPVNAPIVTYVPSDKSELKPGVKIVTFNAVKQSDGTWQATSVNIGRDGMMPPM
jgi:hypothetical protein